jgi:hypothetical protein
MKKKSRTIYTLGDAVRERHLKNAELNERADRYMAQQRAFYPVWVVYNELDQVVGRCVSHKRAVAFIRDSLNSANWTIKVQA